MGLLEMDSFIKEVTVCAKCFVLQCAIFYPAGLAGYFFEFLVSKLILRHFEGYVIFFLRFAKNNNTNIIEKRYALQL